MINQRKFNWTIPLQQDRSDLQLAIDTLRAKAPVRKLAWRYYDGDHPTEISTKKLEEVFRKAGMQFVINWMSVVVDSVNDRIEIDSFNHSNADELNKRWQRQGLDREYDEAVLDMIVSGEGFMIGDMDDDNNQVAYANKSYHTHVFYDDRLVSKKRFAAKMWEDDDGYNHVQLYYHEKFEHYKTQKARKPDNTTFAVGEGEYELLEDDPGTGANPWNQIPVWHFTMDPHNCMPDFAKIVSIQDAVNKVFTDMIATAEFNAFALKWMISNVEVDPHEETKLRVPGVPWAIFNVPPAPEGEQPTQLGEWSQGSLADYLASLDHLSLAISSISRTPKHYFTTTGGDAPSGEALQTQEAPLFRKVGRYVKNIRAETQDFAAWILGNAEDVEVMFADVRTIQAQTEAETRSRNVEAGIPLITLLRDSGWTESDLEQLEEDFIRMEEMKEAVDPEAAMHRMERAQEKVAEQMQGLAKEAMEAVRDGAIDALARTGAMDRILEQIEQRRDS